VVALDDGKRRRGGGRNGVDAEKVAEREREREQKVIFCPLPLFI
jgi:hypothetical protein